MWVKVIGAKMRRTVRITSITTMIVLKYYRCVDQMNGAEVSNHLVVLVTYGTRLSKVPYVVRDGNSDDNDA